jgi:hypothetical protein
MSRHSENQEPSRSKIRLFLGLLRGLFGQPLDTIKGFFRRFRRSGHIDTRLEALEARVAALEDILLGVPTVTGQDLKVQNFDAELNRAAPPDPPDSPEPALEPVAAR